MCTAPLGGQHRAAEDRPRTQNKIPEAMAKGVPVVTTGWPPAASMPRPVNTCWWPTSEMVDAVLRIVDNPASASAWHRPAVNGMLSHHAWPRSMQRLDAIIERCRAGFAAPHSPSKVPHEHQHLGLRYVVPSSLACLARDGHQVVGVDIDRTKPISSPAARHRQGRGGRPDARLLPAAACA